MASAPTDRTSPGLPEVFRIACLWVTDGMTDHRELTEHAHALSEHAHTVLEAAHRALPNLDDLRLHHRQRPRTGRRIGAVVIVFVGVALAILAKRRWGSSIDQSGVGVDSSTRRDPEPSDAAPNDPFSTLTTEAAHAV